MCGQSYRDCARNGKAFERLLLSEKNVWLARRESFRISVLDLSVTMAVVVGITGATPTPA
jgi:hypothetical protein